MHEVAAQPAGHAAISLCATRSGLLDKVIAADLGLQDAVWSRIKSGQCAMTLEALIELMRRCGNEAPLHWLLLRMNYDPRSLRQLEDAKDRQIRQQADEIEHLKQREEMFLDLLGKLRGAA